MAKKSTSEPIPTEAVAILCGTRDCLGFALCEISQDEASTGQVRHTGRACSLCNGSLYYGKVLRNPSNADVKITLLERERDQARRERDKIKTELNEAKIRLETINQTLDKLGRIEHRFEGPFRGYGPFRIPY